MEGKFHHHESALRASTSNVRKLFKKRFNYPHEQRRLIMLCLEDATEMMFWTGRWARKREEERCRNHVNTINDFEGGGSSLDLKWSTCWNHRAGNCTQNGASSVLFALDFLGLLPQGNVNVCRGRKKAFIVSQWLHLSWEGIWDVMKSRNWRAW